MARPTLRPGHRHSGRPHRRVSRKHGGPTGGAVRPPRRRRRTRLTWVRLRLRRAGSRFVRVRRWLDRPGRGVDPAVLRGGTGRALRRGASPTAGSGPGPASARCGSGGSRAGRTLDAPGQWSRFRSARRPRGPAELGTWAASDAPGGVLAGARRSRAAVPVPPAHPAGRPPARNRGVGARGPGRRPIAIGPGLRTGPTRRAPSAPVRPSGLAEQGRPDPFRPRRAPQAPHDRAWFPASRRHTAAGTIPGGSTPSTRPAVGAPGRLGARRPSSAGIHDPGRSLDHPIHARATPRPAVAFHTAPAPGSAQLGVPASSPHPTHRSPEASRRAGTTSGPAGR
jgi:hypothetical protein